MTPLKSLAHPEWPYAGTAHEWRGFVKGERSVEFAPEEIDRRYNELKAVYQKQNLGPELP